ncbi:LysR family transcriptional regulator [Clostridium sp. JS66]|uniref:LysR family transcriptional regulator n=1 Tax=Clostridium sp. JS66 TaxID=3064705 RepID=UPI00298D8ADB|nr:LysR family transcriptional regulator [Clostridium sp. JS66]WPC44414.1 LysR family transcriptional regulator [Clostridium sp. JS66]
MEIRQLQTFITIAELGGFTKAAEHLGYAQSTITSHIQILESELGIVLFDRLGKKIVLTDVGRRLVPKVREMLEFYKEIKNITESSNCISGNLVIGAGESLSIYRLGEILKEYRRTFPKVNIILKNSICSDLRKRLHNGELDVIFTIEQQIKDEDLVIRNLKDEKMMFISAPEVDLNFLYPNAKNNRSKEPIIFSEKGCSFRIFFENYLKQKKIKYANPLEFSSIEATKKCVMNGLGISFLPFYTVESEIEQGNLKGVELSKSSNDFHTQLIYHKDKKISQPMSKLIEITLNHCCNW